MITHNLMCADSFPNHKVPFLLSLESPLLITHYRGFSTCGWACVTWRKCHDTLLCNAMQYNIMPQYVLSCMTCHNMLTVWKEIMQRATAANMKQDITLHKITGSLCSEDSLLSARRWTDVCSCVAPCSVCRLLQCKWSVGVCWDIIDSLCAEWWAWELHWKSIMACSLFTLQFITLARTNDC